MTGRAIAFLSRLVGRQAETSTSGRNTVASFPSLITEGEPSSMFGQHCTKLAALQSLLCNTSQPLGPPARRRPSNLQGLYLMVCSPADAQATKARSVCLQMVVDGTTSPGMKHLRDALCRTAQ